MQLSSINISLFKKIFLAFCVLLVAGVVFAFGGKSEETQTTIVGHIKYFGNAPFEFAGFETVDGFLYTLKVQENAKFSLKDIEAEQGNMLELTGEIDKSQENGLNVLKDGIFVVYEWKKL